ncbi:N(4)-acetylcytidine aminohydrolase [Shewanella atlantica]|uniref:N(4)-acetylcytidine aminohydrolase n=1 Tax=Shewanella atlantica TaxID=271099 RepID=UPI003734CC99
MSSNKITFYQRFEKDILSGAKTITLRDESESHFRAGQAVTVSTYETDRWFCDVMIDSVERIKFDDLNAIHAEQENMTLSELKAVITEIYGEIETLWMISFHLVRS